MKLILLLLLSIVGLFLGLAVVWRLASRRQALPCPARLSWLVELENPLTRVNRAAVIVQHVGIEPGMAVLDIGCGPGRLTIPVAKRVGQQGEIVAVDMQAGMLRRAQERAQAASLTNIRFIQAEVGAGQLERRHFDRALLITTLGEIRNREVALREIYDALKPGGILSVTESLFDPHFQRRDTVVQLAEAAGFREKAFFGGRFAFTLLLEKPSCG